MTNNDIWTKCSLPGAPTTAEILTNLDEVFPGEWDFTLEMLSPNMASGAWAFKGRLQIRGVIRDAVGYSPDRMLDAENQAFKRCAVLFGLGSADA